MSPAAPAIDAARVIADLRELDRRTGGPGGARRVAWTDEWRVARELLAHGLSELGLEPERDEAANLWAFLEGDREPALALGSHLDSVPAGGWLDGALGVFAALGVLRAWVEAGPRPPATLALVDWADEEGARFGRSLFGSSAFAGTLRPDELAGLRDGEGRAIADVLAAHGVELEQAPRASERRERIGSYLELHIEQGPLLETDGVAAAAVTGCAGVERHRFTVRGQASHAGTTPMDSRRDAGLAAAAAALRIERIGSEAGGVATTGVLRLRPGIPTAVAGEAELVVDLRHAVAGALAAMLESATAAVDEAAAARGCEVEREPVWRIEPIGFDRRLVGLARNACGEVAGTERELASGALHDAAEVARVLPAAMVFCPSMGGVSHAPQENTTEPDLAAGIEAFGLFANRVLEGG